MRKENAPEVMAGCRNTARALLGTINTCQMDKPGEPSCVWPGLAGKRNEVIVRSFDDQGKVVKESKPISVPERVVVGVTHGRSFHSTARLAGDKMLLIWLAQAG